MKRSAALLDGAFTENFRVTVAPALPETVSFGFDGGTNGRGASAVDTRIPAYGPQLLPASVLLQPFRPMEYCVPGRSPVKV